MGLVGGQGGCERRIEVFVKIQKINFGGGVGAGGWGRGGGVGLGGVGVGGGGVGLGGGQGGCDRRIEVFGKIHKKKTLGGSGCGGLGWGGGVGSGWG